VGVSGDPPGAGELHSRIRVTVAVTVMVMVAGRAHHHTWGYWWEKGCFQKKKKSFKNLDV